MSEKKTDTIVVNTRVPAGCEVVEYDMGSGLTVRVTEYRDMPIVKVEGAAKTIIVPNGNGPDYLVLVTR